MDFEITGREKDIADKVAALVAAEASAIGALASADAAAIRETVVRVQRALADAGLPFGRTPDWPVAIAGCLGLAKASTPLFLADINPDLLSQGKLRLVQLVLEGLQDGTIGTGVTP